jgi:hypothetical protein
MEFIRPTLIEADQFPVILSKAKEEEWKDLLFTTESGLYTDFENYYSVAENEFCDFSLLDGVSSLERLHLNKLKALSDENLISISKLSSLKELELPSCYIGDEGFELLEPLTSLEKLNLSSNKLSGEGVNVIESLNNLIELNLSYNNIDARGISSITRLPKLKILNLGVCHLEEDVEGLDKLANIEELCLGDNGIGPEGAKQISKLEGLEVLDLFSNFIREEGAIAISKLENLRELYLTTNDIMDKGAIAVAKLKKVKKLSVDDNQIGNRGAKVLLKNALQYDQLDLCNNPGIDIIPDDVFPEMDGPILHEAYKKRRRWYWPFGAKD